MQICKSDHPVVPTVVVTAKAIISTTMVTLAALQLMRKMRCSLLKKERILKAQELVIGAHPQWKASISGLALLKATKAKFKCYPVSKP